MLNALPRRISFFCFLFAVFETAPAFAQAGKLHQALLDATNGFTLMSVAAHPDDESIEAVTYYRQKLGARVVVVVASRGEGGQNEIGPELYADLAVVRSKEMRRAEAISGSEYYNMNFVDFGFAREVEETYHKWGREEIRRRLVWMIRRFRPQVIITNHDSQSGHSNHQAIGREVVWAFQASADPAQFPDQLAEGLPVWQPSRLFWLANEPATNSPPMPSGEDRPWLGVLFAKDLQGIGGTPAAIAKDSSAHEVSLPVGEYSTWLGKTFARYAAEALSQHRSQGMEYAAARIPDGPRWRKYRRIAAAPNVAPPAAMPPENWDFFSGLASAWDTAPALSKQAQAALRDLSAQAYSLTPDRQAVLELARALLDELDKHQTPMPEHLRRRVNELLASALGVEFEVTADSLLVAGEAASLGWQWRWEGFGGPTNSSGRPRLLQVYALGYRIGVGDTEVARAEEVLDLPGDDSAVHFSATPRLARNLPPTRPLSKIIYRSPRLPEPVWGEANFSYHGVRFVLHRIGRAGKEIPEIATPLEIEEPRLPVIVTPADAGRDLRLPVHVQNHLAAAQDVVLLLREKENVVARVNVTVRSDTLVGLALPIPASLPAAPWSVTVEVREAGRRDPRVVSYQLVPVDVNVPAVRVGLISSYDSTLGWALRSVHLPYVIINDGDLQAGDFHQAQAIIVDMRAYLARPALRANNVKLLEWVKEGGRALVMYHKTMDWNPVDESSADEGYFSPYMLRLGPDRVTDETAPVTMLDPTSPFWRTPNQITADDWQGWVQERGLYFPRRWDLHFKPLVAMADPGATPLDGGMLAADYGKGSYLYTSLVWYRQLRAGVPGAFRVLMNLLAAPSLQQP